VVVVSQDALAVIENWLRGNVVEATDTPEEESAE
jgi:hypothetical protein